MKKVLLFVLIILSSFTMFGKVGPTFGRFGIQPETNWEGYKKYIGKTFRYLPSNPLTYLEREMRLYAVEPGEDYILSSVKEKDYSHILFTFNPVKEPKKKIKVDIPNSWMDQFPFLNVEAFEEERAKCIGKTYSHPQVKQTYSITDVVLKEQEMYKETRLMPTYVFSDGREFISLDGLENSLFSEALSGKYYSTLVRVEKPEDASNKYSEVKSFDEKEITKFSFEDELISIIIFGDSRQFNFVLKNKTQNSIKIIWDDAVFVGTNGSTSKIMHAGTRYSQRDASQPASTIIRGASLDDVACPTANVRYSDWINEWITESMYPSEPSNEVKQVRLMLPIQVKEVVNEYVFVFDVAYRYNHPELLNYEW